MTCATPADIFRFPLWKRALIWIAVLAPFFFITYNLANTLAARQSQVGSIVFAWESHIPLWPWTIVPYWSIDLFYGLSFFLFRRPQSMDRHGLRLLTVQLICVSCFLIWPLHFSFERPVLSGYFGWMFDVLMGFDQPYNQAPSLHIAILVVLWDSYARYFRGIARGFVHVWSVLIGLSVLTTWQHHFIDIPTGFVAGAFAVWLWPMQGAPIWRCLRRPAGQMPIRLALRYLSGAILCVLLAVGIGGSALWLLWGTVSLVMVAANYLIVGAAGFGKQSDGRIPLIIRLLFMPYLLAAWLNSRLWTRRQPAANQITDGVWLGRFPATGELSRYGAIVDLCAELPHAKPPINYSLIPVLDLTSPSVAECLQAAHRIADRQDAKPVLVCCALGYSRSAMALVTWMILSGLYVRPDDAIAYLRTVRPGITFTPQQMAVLHRVADQLSGEKA